MPHARELPGLPAGTCAAELDLASGCVSFGFAGKDVVVGWLNISTAAVDAVNRLMLLGVRREGGSL